MNLKALRLSKGLTQSDVSNLTSIPLRTYKRIESDFRYQNTDKYLKAVDILNKTQIKKKVEKKYRLAIVGMGFVGFSLGILLSKHHNVTFVDIDEEKINKVNNRQSVIDDNDIKDYLNGKYRAINVKEADYSLFDYVFIALPTNYDKERKTFKCDDIVSLVKQIRKQNKECPIIIKSTVDVGFCSSLTDKGVIYAPEFLREGTAVRDSQYPDRIVIGCSKNNRGVIELLKSICHNNPPTLTMSYQEAEAVKLFSNSYLALRVSFFNEIDSFAEDHKLNSKSIIQAMSLDNRIGDYYNNPSFGYGGYCLPKDTLVASYQVNQEVFNSISESNSRRIEHIFKKVVEILRKKNKRSDEIVIGFYKLNAKSGVNNSRSSSSAVLKDLFEQRGFETYVFDGDFSKLEKCDVILANRMSKELVPYLEKVYTRDLFNIN